MNNKPRGRDSGYTSDAVSAVDETLETAVKEEREREGNGNSCHSGRGLACRRNGTADRSLTVRDLFTRFFRISDRFSNELQPFDQKLSLIVSSVELGHFLQLIA